MPLYPQSEKARPERHWSQKKTVNAAVFGPFFDGFWPFFPPLFLTVLSERIPFL
jgi:hypothetical protein